MIEAMTDDTPIPHAGKRIDELEEALETVTNAIGEILGIVYDEDGIEEAPSKAKYCRIMNVLRKYGFKGHRRKTKERETDR